MNIKFLLGLCLSVYIFSVFGQSSAKVDEVVSKIYNLDFTNIQNQLAGLEKTDPQIASYLKFDFLWWKMISSNSVSTESDFVTYKNAFQDNIDDDDKDFKTLIYYLYQIRFENFKKINFSKYLTALKCQVYLQKIDEDKSGTLKPLEKKIFQMIVEFDKCLKYKFISEFDPFTTRNKNQLQASLEKIEKLQNEQFSSFETIKNYFLGKIYLEIVNDSVKAFEKFSKLSEDFPDNGVFKDLKNKCKSNISIDQP